MNRKQNFEKHYSRLRLEAWLLSLLWGLVLGFGCGTLTALILWFTKLDGLIPSLAAAAGVTIVAMLIFYLARFRPNAVKNARRLDRLGLEDQYTEILGVKIPMNTIPVTPGRNLAVILEVAAMNNRQRKFGYNPALEFIEQTNRHFEQNMGNR